MNKSALKVLFLIILLLTILPLALFLLVHFAPPREAGGTSEAESSGRTSVRERRASRAEARTVRHESREENTAAVEYDMDPDPHLTEGEIADRRKGIVGAINPYAVRGKQATPYPPGEVPGDSGIVVQYAGSPDDMISAPPPPPPAPENDLWGGRPATPITPENMRGIGGVRRVDPNDPFFQQEIPNPFNNR